MNKRKFLIPSLLAAGFSNNPVSAAVNPQFQEPEPVKKNMFAKFRLNHMYDLAAHRSHGSHSSHGSHRSSSGGGYGGTSRTPRAPAAPLPVFPTPRAPSKITLKTMEVQAALLALGYYNGAIDGIIGSGSRSALSRFQADYGLKVTGTITPEVLDAMGITAN
ncbi:MAG: peptidoglycan-binding protein [Paracoccaceae bacterium]